MFVCRICRTYTPNSFARRPKRHSLRRSSTARKVTSIAPRPHLNIKEIRQNENAIRQNCLDRNYVAQASYPREVAELFDRWLILQESAVGMRRRRKELNNLLKDESTSEGKHTAALVEEARTLKETLNVIEKQEKGLDEKIQDLAIQLPNASSEQTPRGSVPEQLQSFNEHVLASVTGKDQLHRNHARLGADFSLLDFVGAAKTSGWGWYFLKKEAALLEQALVQYAISVTLRHGFSLASPPSMVYSHISAACGFRPRDQNGEQQVYDIEQSKQDIGTAAPTYSLAGTAEIPFAGMMAETTFDSDDLPLYVVGSSRCYRAEAGARGAQTKGLYRVHEFTKVEMFAWTTGGTVAFETMLRIQKEILQNLGLYCRVLEMPTADLGASAARKQDIEAYFPSRALAGIDEGWGELTSASMCTDYQSRRLDTRFKKDGKLEFAHTVNGTALAVPRVLAAILEYGWSPKEDAIEIPEVLWPWMHGIRMIQRPR